MGSSEGNKTVADGLRSLGGASEELAGSLQGWTRKVRRAANPPPQWARLETLLLELVFKYV